jgi:deazaflavin-dependent oxidoreductase (nitroreductase family)
MSDSATRYVMPTTPVGRLMGNFFNSSVARLTKLGISVWGSRVLYVRGRSSGEWRTTPVNPLPYEGSRYLVAPRGHTQWVKNLRVAGGGELHVGRRAETFTAVELADTDKPEILRAYLEDGGRRLLRRHRSRRHRRSASRHRPWLPGFPHHRQVTRGDRLSSRGSAGPIGSARAGARRSARQPGCRRPSGCRAADPATGGCSSSGAGRPRDAGTAW